MLRRSPSLTEQVKSHIKERILNEEFPDGRIPSEMELANELGVSRTTVRDALSRLENEGAIYRKQGAGTFVNRPGLQIKSRLEEIWSYAAVLQAHGYTPSTHVLGVRRETADTETAAALHLDAGEEVTSVQKLFLEDGQPVILTQNHIPSRLVKRPFAAETFNQPIYHFLAEYCQQRLSYYFSEIVPVIADTRLADLLHVQPQSALISFDEVGYNDANEPVLKARSYFRDDLLRFRLIRREAA